MDEKKVQDEATLEKVTGGTFEAITALYHCPKCGAEEYHTNYHTSYGSVEAPVCMNCFVRMEQVPGTEQRETF